MRKPEYYKDAENEHRWRLSSENGEIVGASSQGFASRQKAGENFLLVTGYEEGFDNDETTEPAYAVRVLETPEGLLAGDVLLPREIAKLLYGAKFTDIDKLLDLTATIFGESAGYTEAVGGPNSNGTYDFGLFQLNSGHAAAWGLSAAEFKAMAFDPARAVVFARKLYVSAGYSLRPWYAYTNGTYKRHLPKSVVGVANAIAELRGLTPVPFTRYA